MESKVKDEGAERGVLAGLFQFGNEIYTDIAHIIDVHCFTSEVNQILWTSMRELLERDPTTNFDIVIILSTVEAAGMSKYLDPKVTIKFLQTLKNFYIEKTNIKTLAGILRKLEVARRLKNKIHSIDNTLESVSGIETMAEILGLVETPIYDTISQLYASSKNEIEEIGNGLDDYIQWLSSNKTDMMGIGTGFSSYDLAIGGGLRRGTLNVIGARPKNFKTSMLDNMAIHIAHDLGYPVLNMDSEMSKAEHWVKLLANLSGVTINDIETGAFVDNIQMIRRVEEAKEKLKNAPYHYLSINGRPFDEVMSLMRRWLIQKVGFDSNGNIKPCVVFYDYLKILDPSELKSLSEHQVLGFQTNALHTMAHKYQVPIVAFVQLNRDGIRVEDSSVVSGSDRIVWNCANLSILKKKSPEELAIPNAPPGNLKLNVLLARHGPGMTEGSYVDLYARGDICKVVDTGTAVIQKPDDIQDNQSNDNLDDQIPF